MGLVVTKWRWDRQSTGFYLDAQVSKRWSLDGFKRMFALVSFYLHSPPHTHIPFFSLGLWFSQLYYTVACKYVNLNILTVDIQKEIWEKGNKGNGKTDVVTIAQRMWTSTIDWGRQERTPLEPPASVCFCLYFDFGFLASGTVRRIKLHFTNPIGDHLLWQLKEIIQTLL